MRIKLEKALNSEMMLRMQLEQRTRQQQPSRQQDSPSLGRGVDTLTVVPVSSPVQTHTTTFYTELTVRVRR